MDVHRPFGTDKSVPYEKNQLFPIQRTAQKPLPWGMHLCIPHEHILPNTNFTWIYRNFTFSR